MVGMLTGDRPVRIEVSGLLAQQTAKRSNYVITVPYPSMSKTIQNISRRGGKVVGVHVGQIVAASGTTIKAETPALETVEAPKAETKANSKSKGKKGR